MTIDQNQMNTTNNSADNANNNANNMNANANFGAGYINNAQNSMHNANGFAGYGMGAGYGNGYGGFGNAGNGYGNVGYGMGRFGIANAGYGAGAMGANGAFNPYFANVMPQPQNPYLNQASTTQGGILATLTAQKGEILKGAAIGAVAAFILTNPTTQSAIFRGIAKLSSLLEMGVEELKERYEDAKAEVNEI